MQTIQSEKPNGRIFAMPENILNELPIGTHLTWGEVSEIHKSRNGVYQRRGQLISLLTDFGKINPCYPDLHGDTKESIFYTGAGRRGDQKLDVWNNSLFAAIETSIEVPLFCKHRIGRWQFLGFWRVTEAKYIFDEKQSRMIWKFTLTRTAGDSGRAGPNAAA